MEIYKSSKQWRAVPDYFQEEIHQPLFFLHKSW